MADPLPVLNAAAGGVGQSLLPLLPILLLGAAGLLAPALDLGLKRKRWLCLWSGTALLASLTITLWLLLQGDTQLYFGGLLRLDPLAHLFNLLFLSGALLTVLASATDLKPPEPHQGEYHLLILLATLGMLLVASSLDLLPLFIGFELTSLSTFALVAYRKQEPRGSEAAMKFFIIGALSSAIMLFGISLLYGLAGSTRLTAIQGALATPTPLAGAALMLLIVGFGFKVAAVPFHAWLPDTYEGAPTPITAFLASASKKMGFAALFRVFFIAAIAARTDWTAAFYLLALLTMTLGNAVALNQKSVKRMLAYSSIAQSGYILIPLAAATTSAAQNQLLLTAGLLHIFAHTFMKGGAFIGVAAVSHWTGGREDIEAYAGLGKKAPFTAFTLLILLLSLAGIPPLLGFWSKAFLVLATINIGGAANWLAVALILNSALSLFYYARVIKYIYIVPNGNPGPQRVKEFNGYTIALAISLAATLFLGVYPQPVIQIAQAAAASLVP